MADVGVSYLLDTPGTDITFNQFTNPFDGQDQYYITEIRGLESPSLRTPQDPVPLGEGALIHAAYYGATHLTFEGLILVQSVRQMDAIVAIRNSMTAALKSALNSIKAPATGTLTFTPQGQALQTITGLTYEVGLETPHADNYNSIQFSFGLVTGDPVLVSSFSESDQTDVVEDVEDPDPPSNPPSSPDSPQLTGDLLVTLDSTDISVCALEGSVTRRLNRPAQAQIKIPMDCFNGCSGPGARLLISFDGGSTIFFHGMVMDWELDGGEDFGYITMNAMDPMELWAHRPVRAADGDFSNPDINDLDGGGTTLTGPSMVEAMLQNTEGDSTAQGNPGLTPPTSAEGPTFLTFGTFETAGVELTGAPQDWPQTIAEFTNLLISTGEVDVVITPTDPGGGIMGTVDVYNGDYGTDRSGSVVFDYGTGSLNVRALRWNQDMTNVCNKLWYFAGPRIETAADPGGDQHWCFNVQGDDCCFTGVDNPPHCVCTSPDQAAMEAAFTTIDACRDDSRTTYGVRMDIQIFDAAGDNCTGQGGSIHDRDLYRWNWLAESWARCDPRTLIHITPTRGTAIGTFDIGDLVGVNIGSGICGGASGAQRVYQYTISWDADGPFELSELQTSSDVGIP